MDYAESWQVCIYYTTTGQSSPQRSGAKNEPRSSQVPVETPEARRLEGRDRIEGYQKLSECQRGTNNKLLTSCMRVFRRFP